MPGCLLIYGASGYTGRLLAARAKARGVDTILTGRNASRLAPVAQSLDLPWRTVGLDDPIALDAALRDATVIVNCAGPFEATAQPIVESCLRTGTHYLDVTGEIPVMQHLLTYAAAAEAAEVMIMPGTGFVVAASDCLAAHVARRLPEAHTLRLGFSCGDVVSRGSLTSMFGMIGDRVPVRRDGVLCGVPAGLLERSFDFGNGSRSAMAMPWPDVFTAWHTTGIPNIEAYVEANLPTRLAYQVFSAVAAEPLRLPVAQRLLGMAAQLWPEGPSEAQRAATPKIVVAEAEDASRRVVTSRLYSPNVYTFTMYSVIAIAERVLGGEVRPGFRTPAGVYGADFILEFDGVRREDVPGRW
ncbi:MAG: saccharopine dehydrogenase NADP-binding domain-containing protein [Acetobacteraceae bacterium]